MKLPRIMLADDHTILLEAFRRLLEGKCEVVGAVSDGRALLKEAPALKPDVVVVDIGMPLLNGLEASRRLKEILPSVKLVFLTMNEDPDLAIEALRTGACAYLLKEIRGLRPVPHDSGCAERQNVCDASDRAWHAAGLYSRSARQVARKNSDSPPERSHSAFGRG